MSDKIFNRSIELSLLKHLKINLQQWLEQTRAINQFYRHTQQLDRVEEEKLLPDEEVLHYRVLKEIKQTQDPVPIDECCIYQNDGECDYHRTTLEQLFAYLEMIISMSENSIKEIEETKERLEKDI